MGEGMTRRHDWDLRLAELIEKRRDQPFKWGSNDCLTFASEVEEAVVGKMTFGYALGCYQTPRQALRMLKSSGYRSTGQAFATVYPKKPPALARRGDFATVSQGKDEATGVVLGQSLAFVGEGGLEFLPLSQATRVLDLG